MKAPDIFPLHYNCYDHHGWADCPALAKRIWQRIRQAVAPDLVWYGVAMKITSPQQLTLYVFDMADNVHGGIGEQIFRCVIARSLTPEANALLTADECAMLDDMLIKAYTAAAEGELDLIEAARRQAQVIELRKQLFGV